jgi:hypothetical protein
VLLKYPDSSDQHCLRECIWKVVEMINTFRLDRGILNDQALFSKKGEEKEEEEKTKEEMKEGEEKKEEEETKKEEKEEQQQPSNLLVARAGEVLQRFWKRYSVRIMSVAKDLLEQLEDRTRSPVSTDWNRPPVQEDGSDVHSTIAHSLLNDLNEQIAEYSTYPCYPPNEFDHIKALLEDAAQYLENAVTSLCGLELLPRNSKAQKESVIAFKVLNQSILAPLLQTLDRFKKHQHHEFMYPNGDRYKGRQENGKKHGYGEHRYADGSQYKGQWKNDRRIDWIATKEEVRREKEERPCI